MTEKAIVRELCRQLDGYRRSKKVTISKIHRDTGLDYRTLLKVFGGEGDVRFFTIATLMSYFDSTICMIKPGERLMFVREYVHEGSVQPSV
jgi:hypothetical protein